LLLGVVGVSFVVGRSLYQTADRSPRAVGSKASESAWQIEEARLPAPASKTETVSPGGRPGLPASPPPGPIVSLHSSGIVQAVNVKARTLVLEDLGAAAAASRLRVELAPDARVVLSERLDRVDDLSHPFKDTVISLSDVRRGDFVVVEIRGPEQKPLARSVVVTLRGNQGPPPLK
jgi:hypothetical protein